jgi:predicted AlkP superfamily pyrophosphatase or phosphodiesterase
LDYCLQKFGVDLPAIAKELREIDQVLKQLITHFESKNSEIIILSEYGINDVNTPIHLNRLLRKAGKIAIREEQGLELLDPGASEAFAVSDHQIAHIYCKNPLEIRTLLEKVPGIAKILIGKELKEYQIAHERCGDLVLVADSDKWFTYYYWLDDAKAPDFARCVDIFKKPGYDPVEMFMDPKNPFIKLRAAYKLARKLLGFRYRMDVIPLDASLVKGSHGSPFCDEVYYPVFISSQNIDKQIPATQVYQYIWETIFPK